MEGEWAPMVMEVLAYKETGTYIIKVSDDCSQLLDDHIVMTQSMSFSPYKKPFEDRINTWEGEVSDDPRCLGRMDELSTGVAIFGADF